ncbi:hypothetical protein ASE01_21875 [Nocardioides sp. Root190]|uniref:polysaccharide deacetylase family protein n=1 Tax=Nocardioides sp. Root190 TaxID=1736488 RepID=UPI000701B422|nr:polysaccharide deacetylase family protein [Nocardioides sp. Root190]KRB72706.1 hypothetical protein ASE01_21875 [Nocardioides sp. Root190]
MRPTTRTAARIARPGVRVLDGISRAGARPQPLTLLGWHRLGRTSGDGLTTTFDDFRRHLDVLDEWGATVLPLDTAVELMAAGELPPRAVALTFDDGYASVSEQAWPELRRRGLPATMFVVSGYLDGRRTFSWDRNDSDVERIRLVERPGLIEAAADGLDIGSHTVSHRWLRHLNPREIAVELAASRAGLEDVLQRPVRSFAYPMGGWTPAIREQVAAAGYDTAITVDRGRNGQSHDPLSLRRCFAFDRPDDLRLQLDGGFTWVRPIDTFRQRRGPRL